MRLFSNSPMFWIGGLAYNIVGVLVAGATLLCSASLDPAETLDFIERERPELTNGFVASIAALVAHPSFPTPRLLVDPSGNLHPLLPDAIRPADPELRHNMLGTTETGSVCLMSRTRPTSPSPARLVRPAGARARRRGSSTPTRLEDVAPSGSWASSGSGARP